MFEKVRKYSIKIIVFYCCSLFFVGAVLSQVAPPPVEDLPAKKKSDKVKLSASMLRLAEEYGDVLDQLQDIIHDYHHYFSKINDKYTRKYQYDLLQFLIKLEDGTYCGNVEKLMNDLKTLTNKLKSDQGSLKAKDVSKKTYKNIVGLRKELEFINEMIEEDLYERLEENKDAMSNIQEHLCNLKEKERNQEYALENVEDIINDIKYQVELLNLNSESTKVKIDLEEKEAIIMALKILKDFEKHYDVKVKLEDIELLKDIEIDPDVNIIEPEEFEDVFEHEVHFDVRDESFTLESGKFGMIREYTDSINVLSPKTQIIIKNKTGNLEIEGWDDDKIFVNQYIELVGDDKKVTKDLLEETKIKIVSNPKGIYVNSYIPNLAKANHQIVSSTMQVKVPYANPVICENSFGETIVSDLDNGITINADNSTIILDNVKGVIKTVNNMGNTTISDSKGEINAISSLGPIHLTDCEGKINLSNSYDEIVLNDCVGSGIIKNSGQITIANHRGNLEIENENGRIDISSHENNLKITNAYQSVFLNDIEGSVEVKNDYADINAFGVSGNFSATNSFGTITANDIEGSFNLNSRSGVINLALDHPYLTNSWIVSDFGKVTLLVDSDNDYLINALTEGGVIKSDFNIEIKKDTEQSSTSLALGNGNIPIEVKGTNTTIVINEE